MVMELVDGQPLDQLIPSGGLRPSEVLRIGVQVADAFAEAHSRQIVHRDLKPANVMVQANGRVKVLDFGLAKLVESPRQASAKTMVTQTAEGTIMGTAAYMSPEQAEGKPLDARSDIFSFGALLYELCTGKRAFRGESNASVLADVLRQDPQPVAEIRSDVPPELARLIMRCLRKDPARRVQSMADLKVAFEELREDVESGKLPTRPPATPPVQLRSGWVVAAASAMAVAAIAVMMWNQRAGTPPAPPTALQPVPLTSYPGRELKPTFSPDGNQIAFAWTGDRDDNLDIYVKLIGPGTPLRLTTDPMADLFPQWSPDGRYVAFMRRLERELVGVLLVPALGGAERRLAQFHTRLVFDSPISALVWTRDSKFLLVSGGRAPGEPSHIHRVSVESGEVLTIVPAEEGSEGFVTLALAPDGRTLAAVRIGARDPRSVRLYQLSPSWEPQGSRVLESITTDVMSLAWTADSRDLVFRIAANVALPLHRVAVAGGQPEAMPWVGADAAAPAIASTGGRLVFVRTFRDTNIWRVTLNASDTAATSMEQLAASSFREVFPQYSPDGKRLVFSSNRSGSIQIWSSDADGSRAVQLTNMDPFATTGSPRWSSDGQRVVFDSSAGGGYQLYEINADGGQPNTLTTGKSNSFIGAWSPDGRWIYFSSDRSGRLEVWRMPSAGGTPEQFTRRGGQSATVSADNAWVYFTKDNGAGGLWRIPVAGGDESRLVDGIFRYNFAVTAEGVY